MSHQKHLRLSRVWERYGYTKATEEEAMALVCHKVEWSELDRAMLCRTAIALERLADLFDPEVREKKRKARESRSEFDEWYARFKILSAWQDQCIKEYREPLEARLGPLPKRCINKFERVLRQYCLPTWEIWKKRDVSPSDRDEFVSELTKALKTFELPTQLARPGTKMQAAYEAWIHPPEPSA